MNSAVLLLLLGVAMVASMAHQHHHHHHRSKIASAVSLEFCAQFYATLSEGKSLESLGNLLNL